jgi:hypothetical protein
MRILITNDDGIHSPGLAACLEIARALSDEVWIVAPEIDQSGVSHSLSLNDPLRMREVGERHFAVKGTPTDCVIMGVRHLMKEKADLVLSGVNRGRNCAEDVTYSGTVAGAMEGTVLGIPSFALSQAYAFTTKHNPFWETAIKHAPDLIKRVLKAGMPRDGLPARTGRGRCRHRAGQARSGTFTHRCAPRRTWKSLLLDRLRAWWRFWCVARQRSGCFDGKPYCAHTAAARSHR